MFIQLLCLSLPSLFSRSFPLPPTTMAGPLTADKKPRMRHSDAQLAALNDLYDQNEYPSLDERALLAQSLTM